MRLSALHGTSRNGGLGIEPRSWPRHAVLAALAAAAVGTTPALAQDSEPGGTTNGSDPTPAPTGDPATDGGAPVSEDPTAARQGRISMRAGRTLVPVGETVTFTGHREPARRGEPVRLRYRPAGGRYETVANTTTDARGNYRLRTKPRRTGSFVAVSPRNSGEKLRSARERVAVRAKVLVEARKHQLKRRGLKVNGRVQPRGGARRVILQRQTPQGWDRVAGTRTRPNGRYGLRWSRPGLGGHVLRTRFRGDESNLAATTALDHKAYVYREDHASYYGPGFYGNTTACGQTLRRGTVGVAHKRLPCGTRVRFHYRGTTRRIRVIDRGPFIAGRRWDLTDAARRKLNFPEGTDDIWADR
jgi:rare lipoprotein A